MKTPEEYDSFTEIKARLDEIVAAVSDESLPLEEALTLYEEAAKLGLRVSALIEQSDGEGAAAKASEDAAELQDSEGATD